MPLSFVYLFRNHNPFLLMEEEKPREFNSFPFKSFPKMMETFSSSLSTNPLFSSIITLYTLILLYFPSSFLGLVFSPVLISTLILLLSLLRLGASQEEKQKEKQIEKGKGKGKEKEWNSAGIVTDELVSAEIVPDELNFEGTVAEDLNSGQSVSEELVSAKIVPDELSSAGIVAEELNSAGTVSYQLPLEQIHEFLNGHHKWVSSQVNGDSNSGPGTNIGPEANPFYEDSFLEWDVRAPLEVIHEAYEGEEEGNGYVLEENRETQMAIIERYASLSMYYPETDTESSSSEGDFQAIGELDSPENMGFRWEEEDGEGLIEIVLDGKRKSEVEEENLIEIDFLRRVSRLDDAFSRRENVGLSD